MTNALQAHAGKVFPIRSSVFRVVKLVSGEFQYFCETVSE